MSELKRSIEVSDIDYRWTDRDGTEHAGFRQGHALALMIMNGAVFINEKLAVDCSDVFVWGCSDGEELPLNEIEVVYRLWRERSLGADVWCVIKRKEVPQEPVEEAMRDAGWDLDALKAEHGLRNNHYDGTRRVLSHRKYATYAARERENGREPAPFDAGWWDGWLKYTDAHPDWNNDAWVIEDRRLCVEWRRQNGYPDEYLSGATSCSP